MGPKSDSPELSQAQALDDRASPPNLDSRSDRTSRRVGFSSTVEVREYTPESLEHSREDISTAAHNSSGSSDNPSDSNLIKLAEFSDNLKPLVEAQLCATSDNYPEEAFQDRHSRAAQTVCFLRGDEMDARKKKKKVLLMGKSGSGKSSMRSIIFSNWVAKDVRRLGATIDVDHTHAKFMGSLTLNLWDCGGQDAFMESYLTNQRKNIFSDVAVLIYVFDIESREFDRDLEVYSNIILALKDFSADAYVFCLIHKMDLIQPEHQERLAEERSMLIRERSHGLKVDTFASSIWNQSLYRAWASIVHKLIPNLSKIEQFLTAFANQISAEEIILFERSTFLTVTSVVTDRGRRNPFLDRHERISNIFKTFKHSIAKNTKSTPASAGFVLWKLQTRQFNVFLQNFTDNTYIFVVMPPGEAAFNCAVYNTASARDVLRAHVDLAEKGGLEGAGSVPK